MHARTPARTLLYLLLIPTPVMYGASNDLVFTLFCRCILQLLTGNIMVNWRISKQTETTSNEESQALLVAHLATRAPSGSCRRWMTHDIPPVYRCRSQGLHVPGLQQLVTSMPVQRESMWALCPPVPGRWWCRSRLGTRTSTAQYVSKATRYASKFVSLKILRFFYFILTHS